MLKWGRHATAIGVGRKMVESKGNEGSQAKDVNVIYQLKEKDTKKKQQKRPTRLKNE